MYLHIHTHTLIVHLVLGRRHVTQAKLPKIFHLPDYGHWSAMTQTDPMRIGPSFAGTAGKHKIPFCCGDHHNNVKLERPLGNAIRQKIA